jgi:hypothetical protein
MLGTLLLVVLILMLLGALPTMVCACCLMDWFENGVSYNTIKMKVQDGHTMDA